MPKTEMKRIRIRILLTLKISIALLLPVFLNLFAGKLAAQVQSVWALDLSGNSAAAEEEQEDTFTQGEFTFVITSRADKTVCLTGMKPDEAVTWLILPETAAYEGANYLVTEISFDNRSAQYDNIKTLEIPSGVTGDILITSTEPVVPPMDTDTEEHPYRVPFPNLQEVVFTGNTAPESIDIFSYLSYQDMLYKVPSGSEAAYEAICRESFLQPILSHYDFEGDHTYMQYAVAPVIVSDSLPHPEPHLFQTDYGVYLVTESAKEGKGTAALIKCRKLIGKYHYVTPDSGLFVYPEWDDYTLESEAAAGSYRYTVTCLKTGALLDFRNITALTIPDTITRMEKNCIYAGDFLNFLFFSKNCPVISSDLFNSGENGYRNGILFYVPTGVEKLEGSFSSFHLNQIYLPEGISVPKSLKQSADKIIFYKEQDGDYPENEIKIKSCRISVKIGSTGKIAVTAPSGSDLHFISMDPGIAQISDSGIITPKHKGCAYVLVISGVTGEHRLLQVTVENTIFQQGAFTYRINYSKTPEVTVISCTPPKDGKLLIFKSSVTYKGKKYTVTQVCAGDYVIDHNSWWTYTSEKGYPRIYDTMVPLISDQAAKSCNITEIVFPSTIRRTVSSLGCLSGLKKVVFKGLTAPALIAFSEQNYDNAVIYVPAKALTAYQNTHWKWKHGDYEYYGRYNKNSIIKLKSYK